MRRARLSAFLGACLLVWGAGSSTEGSPVSAAAAPTPLEVEQSVSAFEEAALDVGVLGFYRDAADGSLVVVVPTELGAGFSLQGLPQVVGMQVKSRVLDVGTATLQRAEARLESIAGQVGLAVGSTFSFRFDPATGKIIVRGELDAQRLDDLLGEYSSHVAYLPGELVLQSRHYDTVPIFGGAEAVSIYGPPPGATFDCTTGFTVKNAAGTRFMAVPRHCPWSLGNEDVINPGSGSYIGDVVDRSDFGQDVALLGGSSYSPQIWVGNSGSSSYRTVKGATTPTVGVAYCRSGAVTFEVCNQVVVALDGYLCHPNGQCTNHNLVEYDQPSSPISQDGDSGAPFYLLSSGWAYIRGMHVGIFGDGTNNGIAENWSHFITEFGVSIVTG